MYIMINNYKKQRHHEIYIYIYIHTIISNTIKQIIQITKQTQIELSQANTIYC